MPSAPRVRYPRTSGRRRARAAYATFRIANGLRLRSVGLEVQVLLPVALLRSCPALLLVVLGAQGSASATQAGAPLDIPDPTKRIADLALLEGLTEEVANALLDLGDALRKREFSRLPDWFGDDFAGHAFDGLAAAPRSEPRAGLSRAVFDAASARAVDRAGFVGGLERLFAGWTRIDHVLWKTKGAEFQSGEGRAWGKAQIFFEAIGATDTELVTLTGWAQARVEQSRGRWRIARLKLDSLEELRGRAPFVEVSSATGIAHVTPLFGDPANRSFAWNGAASADVDGDGRWDLFVPSTERNFLYLGRADGTFSEAARERGLERPGGGTGAVFFDFDGDGDQDLAVGRVGWRESEARIGGGTLLFFVNEGDRFVERGAELGLGEPWVATTLTVADFDLDGWPDLFVCGYGRVDAEHNDSWLEAQNGAPNALYKNLGGKRFQEVGSDAGVRGSRWTYASAAADYDDDGDLDLYVANDYGSNELFRNEGNGRFVDVAPELGVTDRGNGMGVAWGDLDQDGRLDLYVADMSSTAGNRILKRLQGQIDEQAYADLLKLAAGNSIFVAKAEGGFRMLPRAAGGVGASWAWAPVLADFDLDGALDVFCANGFITGRRAHDT